MQPTTCTKYSVQVFNPLELSPWCMYMLCYWINSKQNDKVSNKFDSNEKMKHPVGKVENAGYQHFLLFPAMFGKVTSSALCGGGIKVDKTKQDSM